MAKKQAAEARATLYSRISKAAQKAVAELDTPEAFGRNSLADGLAFYCWLTCSDCLRNMNWDEPRLTGELVGHEIQLPKIPRENRLEALALGYQYQIHRDWGLLRRFLTDDPAELARGVFLNSRLRWAISGCRLVDCDTLIDACAVRDFRLAVLMAETGDQREADPRCEHFLTTFMMSALLRRDSSAVDHWLPALRKKKLKGVIQGIASCIIAIAEKDEKSFQDGLRIVLNPKRRDESAYAQCYAIFLEGHGLFRLAEYVSPALVADIDTQQDLPWDKEFHSWTTTHENAIEGVDLSAASPLARSIIVDLAAPDYLVWSREDGRRWEKEQLSRRVEIWIIDVGQNPEAVNQVRQQGSVHYPVQVGKLGEMTILLFALPVKLWLERAGATVELRDYQVV